MTKEISILKNNKEVVASGRITDEYIHDLEVAPQYRRQGLATDIVQDLIGLGAKYLWVAKDNAPAIELYRKFGFEVVAEEYGFYKMKRETND